MLADVALDEGQSREFAAELADAYDRGSQRGVQIVAQEQLQRRGNDCVEVRGAGAATAAEGTDCVEVAWSSHRPPSMNDGVLVRDSKNSTGPVLTVPVVAWHQVLVRQPPLGCDLRGCVAGGLCSTWSSRLLIMCL